MVAGGKRGSAGGVQSLCRTYRPAPRRFPPVLMAKFGVYRLRDGNGYLLDCQADLLRDLNTRFVVPLLPVDTAPKPAARLNPIFEIQGEQYMMVTQFAATVPSSELRTLVMSLSEQGITIGNALDMLISGY